MFFFIFVYKIIDKYINFNIISFKISINFNNNIYYVYYINYTMYNFKKYNNINNYLLKKIKLLINILISIPYHLILVSILLIIL